MRRKQALTGHLSGLAPLAASRRPNPARSVLDLIGAGKMEQAARLMEKHLEVALKTQGALVAPKKRAG